MMIQQKLHQLKNEAEDVLRNNILPFWMDKMVDRNNGGFFGRISGKDEVFPNAPKGVVLNARILWIFSAAYRLLGNPEYFQTAKRAKEYLLSYFFDKECGGLFWSLNHKGVPLETKKQIYAQGFGIYGLSEYFRATNDNEALEYAIKLYRFVEKYSFDSQKNGYLESFTRNWQLIDDMRLSEKDANEQKTMNTHLHILEPYTNLYRVWKDDALKEQLKNLIKLFLSTIIGSNTHHLRLFFDSDWNDKSETVSFGHDIEASWLLHEAAIVLGDEKLLRVVEDNIPLIVKASEEGIQPDGGMAYEQNIRSGHLDTEKHWWVQAEAVVGFLNHYQFFGDEKSLNKTLNCWLYIKENLIDSENGEWFWSVYPNGKINRTDDKAGIWKCPYHNGRMCLEIIERVH